MLALNSLMTQGDSLQVLTTWEPKSKHFIITSPPYMALRDYKVKGQIGRESSSEEYLNKLWATMDQCYRVLRDDGTLWVNLGDTFAGSGGPGGDHNPGGLKDQQPTFKPEKFDPRFKQSTYRMINGSDDGAHARNYSNDNGLFQPKCLMMIPERFAWGMIQRGWILRAKIVWFKPNGMIEPSKDRPKLDYEWLYMFSKAGRYWFNYLEAKKALKTVTVKRHKHKLTMSQHHRALHENWQTPTVTFGPKIGGIRGVGENGNNQYSGDVWKNSDNQAKIGSVWGLPPESIWSIAPKTFGHEYCETCDELVKSKLILFKCVDNKKTKQPGCGYIYKRLDPSEILKANGLDPEQECPVCERTLKRHLTANGKGRAEGLQPEVIDCGYFDLPQLQKLGCPQCGNMAKEMICPVCHKAVHMHFAMFPEELVERALKMCCPDQVCKQCGAPRWPVYTPTEEYSKLLGKSFHEHQDDEAAGQMQEKVLPKAVADYRIKEWTKCDCNAGFEPGIAVDIFAGFGTTGAVALKNYRRFQGIDLDIKNVKASMRRLSPLVPKLEQTKLEV